MSSMRRRMLFLISLSASLSWALGCDDVSKDPTGLTPPEPQYASSSQACRLGLTAEEASDLVDDVRDELLALRQAGELDGAHADALARIVGRAASQIERGNACTARAQLEAFTNRVRSLVKRNALSEDAAAALQELVQRLLRDGGRAPRFAMISAGETHTCALTDRGQAYCWGGNFNGELGNGTTEHQRVPTRVRGGHRFVFLDVGLHHTCALKASGAAYCWGHNVSGQIGDGTTTARHRPARVRGGHRFTSIDLGLFHTCALDGDGKAYCWGTNDLYQLGTGEDISHSDVPRAVAGGHGFSSISAGWYHTCALEDGDAYCWGGNIGGEIGDGTTAFNRRTPTRVTGGHTFTSIGAGWYFTCALDDEGEAHCWGANFSGQLGDGSGPAGRAHEPVPVSGGRSFLTLDVGWTHSCALDDDGDAYCWGANVSGMIGDGSTVDRRVPTLVEGDHAFTIIRAGWTHTCALEDDGTAFCWGNNALGQLGDGTTTNRTVPTRVVGR